MALLDNIYSVSLEELEQEWANDGPIQPTLENIANQSLRIFELHQKYWKHLSRERQYLRRLEYEFKRLQVVIDAHFSGDATLEDIQKYDLPPAYRKPKTVLDKKILMEGEKSYIKFALEIGCQQDKVDFLQDVIKSIHSRGYQIKNWIEIEKFKHAVH